VDCTGGYLAAGDVDGSYRGHGGGHGREDLKEGEMIEKKDGQEADSVGLHKGIWVPRL
jgi:hypothetical protein